MAFNTYSTATQTDGDKMLFISLAIMKPRIRRHDNTQRWQ